MYHPYIRQKLSEARAVELERIAEEDRAAQARAPEPPARRLDWLRRRLGRRRRFRAAEKCGSLPRA